MKKSFVLCCFLAGLALSSSFAQSTVFIVRHAEKADDSKDADLSEAGRARAEALANMLRDSKISVIYTTEFKRTQQTAAPLAKTLGLTITTLPAEDRAALVAKLRRSHCQFVSRRSRQHHPGRNQSARDIGTGQHIRERLR
jgi:broad specificity phosphatase PhoE